MIDNEQKVLTRIDEIKKEIESIQSDIADFTRDQYIITKKIIDCNKRKDDGEYVGKELRDLYLERDLCRDAKDLAIHQKRPLHRELESLNLILKRIKKGEIKTKKRIQKERNKNNTLNAIETIGQEEVDRIWYETMKGHVINKLGEGTWSDIERYSFTSIKDTLIRYSLIKNIDTSDIMESTREEFQKKINAIIENKIDK